MCSYGDYSTLFGLCKQNPYNVVTSNEKFLRPLSQIYFYPPYTKMLIYPSSDSPFGPTFPYGTAYPEKTKAYSGEESVSSDKEVVASQGRVSRGCSSCG